MNQWLKGAQKERDAFRAKLRRRMKVAVGAVVDELQHLIDWVDARTKRYNKRPGGLQSKKEK